MLLIYLAFVACCLIFTRFVGWRWALGVLGGLFVLGIGLAFASVGRSGAAEAFLYATPLFVVAMGVAIGGGESLRRKRYGLMILLIFAPTLLYVPDVLRAHQREVLGNKAVEFVKPRFGPGRSGDVITSGYHGADWHFEIASDNGMIAVVEISGDIGKPRLMCIEPMERSSECNAFSYPGKK